MSGMFGKRSTGEPAAAPPAQKAPPPAAPPRVAQAAPKPKPAAPAAPQPRQAAPEPVDHTTEYRSEAYYRVKSTIFNALIETIDLTQLAQLDPESARDEIRDIVAEIISIKNVVMSIAEQE